MKNVKYVVIFDWAGIDWNSPLGRMMSGIKPIMQDEFVKAYNKWWSMVDPLYEIWNTNTFKDRDEYMHYIKKNLETLLRLHKKNLGLTMLEPFITDECQLAMKFLPIPGVTFSIHIEERE